MGSAAKVTIVTGGASGIGAATCRLLVSRGTDVVIADVQDELGETLAFDLGPAAVFRHVDVTAESDVARVVDETVERWGELAGLYNNAGIIGATGPLDETPVEEWDYTVDMVLRSVFLGTKHAARVMKPRHRGAIVNTASIAAFRGGIGPHAYAAAKAAVVALTRNAAAELGTHGIRVNAVAPGRIATPMVAAAWTGNVDQVDEAYQALLAESPLPDRAGQPRDIAEAAVWLLSDAAGYISGHTIVVDGGMLGGTPPAAQALTGKYVEHGPLLRQGGARGLPAERGNS
jgi:NAD(P)-dependent dehydrogenase (short-subunit alcohol dehydrogenase family)